jgi:diguanylate cyclase (GGDEF)-like protein
MSEFQPRPRGARSLWAVLGLAGLGLIGYACWLAAGAPADFSWVADHLLYHGAILLAALACLIRAIGTPHLRVAWIAFGLGLAAWVAGDVYWVEVLADLKHIPYPSPADAGYLLAIPCFFVAIGVLAHDRLGQTSAATWFDGTIAALAAAAGASALLAPALVDLTHGEPSTVFTNLAYPLGDVLLLAFIAAAVAVSGLRGARALLLIGAGLVLWTVGDGLYLVGEATGTYAGGWLDLLWPLGALVIGISAAISLTAPTARRRRYRSGLVVPLLSTAVAVGVLVWDHFERAHVASIWLAAATLVIVAMRLIVSFRDNDRLVDILHADATTDELTELRNRRALIGDLDDLLGQAPGTASAHLFGLFDLDGFKAYNDSFGHPAGDALLARLGASLTASIGSLGTPYRLGGDEFCVLIPLDGNRSSPLAETCRAALSERGEGFTVGASAGIVILPSEARTSSEALRLADQRLYLEKAERSTRSEDQTRTLLMRILRDREPALGEHVDGVTRLALELGRQMRLNAEALDVLGRAAELHDIGKIAIPDDVLHKPGPLDDAEWGLMRRHTLIGERLLGSAPALAPVAAVVRSSHERWDGTGYPDGLAGTEISLASRIILVCDAFEAMTAHRPYQPAMPFDAALAELRRCAGSQFDPAVVELFCGLRGDDGAEVRGSTPDTDGRLIRPRLPTLR